MITRILGPLWDKSPHRDVRACLSLTLLNFVEKLDTDLDDQIDTAWNILKQATEDDYLPVIHTLFEASSGVHRWPLVRLRSDKPTLYEKFVNEIQLKIFDHPKSLEARTYAWNNIDHNHVKISALIDKANLIILDFGKDSNALWETAFNKIIFFYHQGKSSDSVR